MSLTYKLLRYVNSASVGVRGEVESVRSALVLLGGEAVLRWVCMATVSGLMSDKAEELAVVCATRAHFCESLGPVVGLPGASQDLVATGMFSAIDALLDVPLEHVLADLPLAADVRAAILGADNALGRVLRVVTAYERGDWDGVAACAAGLSICEVDLIGRYLDAVEWSRAIFGNRIWPTPAV